MSIAPRTEVPDGEPVQERSYGIIPIRLVPNSTDSSGILSTANTEVLLIKQRSSLRGHDPFWSFPKGHPEREDKSTIDSAIREVKEETGIIIKEEGILFRDKEALTEKYRNQLWGWVKEVRYWVGLVERQGQANLEVQMAELVDAKWLKWEEALETLTFNKGKELLRKVMEMLDENGGKKLDYKSGEDICSSRL